LKQLVDKGHFDKVRFWGKIFGTQKNYFVAEAEQHTDDGDDEDDGTEEAQIPEEKESGDDEEFDGQDDPLPKSTYKPPPITPKEQRGTGVNRYTYYVCNHRMFFFVEFLLLLFIELF
jgi:radial spoke head protein 4A